MSGKLKDYIYIIVILILGLNVINWYRGDFLVNAGDFNFSLSPTHAAYRTAFFWDSQQYLGLTDQFGVAKLFPYNLFLAFWEQLGFTIYQIQKILFYVLFISTGISAYFLVRYICTGMPFHRTGAFFGAIFYMFNLFVIQLRWGGGYMQAMFAYAYLPLMLLFWFRALDRSSLKELAVFSVISLLAAPSLGNIANFTPFAIIASMDFVFRMVKDRRLGQQQRLIGQTIKGAVLYLCINLWWLIGNLLSAAQAYLNVVVKSTGTFQVLESSSSDAGFVNLFRNLGVWGFFSTYQGDKYVQFSDVYTTPIFIMLGLALAGFSMSILILNRRRHGGQYYIALFGVLYLFALWLIKGTHPPGGVLFAWAVDTLPILSIFRATQDKFGPIMIVSSAALIGVSVQSLLHWINGNNGDK